MEGLVNQKVRCIQVGCGCRGDLFTVLAIPEPKVLHGFHRTHCFAPRSLSVCPTAILSWHHRWKSQDHHWSFGIFSGQGAGTCRLWDETLIKLLPLGGEDPSLCCYGISVTLLVHKDPGILLWGFLFLFCLGGAWDYVIHLRLVLNLWHSCLSLLSAYTCILQYF